MGLDEVPSSTNRDRVLRAIQDFWIDASSINADVIAIATTRPQGYEDDFGHEYYQHYQLVNLSNELGMHFAERLVDIRYGNEADRRERVLARLGKAFNSEATSRLMRTPLQVTIMTALVDRSGQPPQARWNLFKSYYEVIYQREIERDIPASDILRENRQDINAIHSQVGLLLQIDTERHGKSDAKLTRTRFVSVVEARLGEEGYSGQRLEELTTQIVDAALQRLVLLVGLESDQIGFEVRSLQEFMAAESLMAAEDKVVEGRLGEIAPIASWRNVFLFAAGRCFEDRQHLRSAILGICSTLNEGGGDRIAAIRLSGSILAMDLLDDGLSRHQPKYALGLARFSFRVLDKPDSNLHRRLGEIYDPELKDVYLEELRRRLNDGRQDVRQAAFCCLMYLLERGIQWAQELADEFWPSGLEAQVAIFDNSIHLGRNEWIARKFIAAMPLLDVSRLKRLGSRGSLGSLSGILDLTSEQAAMIEVLQLVDTRSPTQIDFLNSKVMHPDVAQIGNHESSPLLPLRNLGECHPSWLLYKSAAEFMMAPSKETLSIQLEAMASMFASEADVFDDRKVPWPLLACLRMCSDETEMIALSKRAGSGELGDTADWLAAEHRWVSKGITAADLLSMTDDRLPFDRDLRTSGFPMTWPIWFARFPPPRESDKLLPALMDIYDQMPESEARSSIAEILELCLLNRALRGRADEQGRPTAMSMRKLQSIYESLPPSHHVILSIPLSHLDGSNEDIAEFFSFMEKFQLVPFLFMMSSTLRQKGIVRLEEAFRSLQDNDSLLPVLGLLAEHGELSGGAVNVATPEIFDDMDHKIASFIIMLAQEKWDVDNTQSYIEFINTTVKLSDSLTNRVITTIAQNQPAGCFVDRFLVAFEQLVPKDDYDTYAGYLHLLDDSLRRRTSKFTDPDEGSRFQLPAGITTTVSV